MSKRLNKVPNTIAGRSDANQIQSTGGPMTRKRKAQGTSNEEHPGDELPVKVSRTISNENQPATGSERVTRKRKAQSLALEDISNTLDDDEKPMKVSRKTSRLDENNNESGFNEIFLDSPSVSPVESLSNTSLIFDLNDSYGSQSSWSDTENHFDKLDDIDILEIMEKLPIESRLNLARTSKRFNNILKENPNRLPLTLNINFDTETLPTFERTYRRITCRNLSTPETEDRKNKIMEVFHSLNNEIKELKFLRSTMSAKCLYDILKTMPQLNSFYVGSSTELAMLQFNEEPLTLANLKKVIVHNRNIESIGAVLSGVTTLEEFAFKSQDDDSADLEVIGIDIGIIDIIRNAIVDEAQENASDNEEEGEPDEPDDQDDFELNVFAPEFRIEILALEAPKYVTIRNVLKRQTELKSLEFCNAFIFEERLDDCAFQLKNLVLFIPAATQKQLKNLADFVLSQTNLESVVVNILCGESEHNRLQLANILGHVMGLKTVKSLKIVFYSGLRMIEFFRDNQTVNPNVQELYIGTIPVSHSHRRIIEAIVRHFPNLERFEMNLEGTWMLLGNAEIFEPLSRLQKLKELRLENLKSECIAEIRRPSLQTIMCRGVFTSQRTHWQQLYANCPNLENINFQFHQVFQPLEVVPFVQDITGSLNKVRRVHACVCGRDLTSNEQEEITEAFNASPSLKAISFCSWKQEKE